MKDVTGILGLAARARKTATGEIVYTQLRARHVHLLILAENKMCIRDRNTADPLFFIQCNCRIHPCFLHTGQTAVLLCRTAKDNRHVVYSLSLIHIYDLEYGSNELHVHRDGIKKGQRVLIVDDLLATGGTVDATIQIVQELGGEVAGCAFLIELAGLKGREHLKDFNVFSLMSYE